VDQFGKERGMDCGYSVKSKPRLLPKRKLEEGESLMSKEEKIEAKQVKIAMIPQKALQNDMVQKMAEGSISFVCLFGI
jgi:hypothetical protein